MFTAASLVLRLNQLTEVEDQEQLLGVHNTADLLENVRSSRTHNQNVIGSLPPEVLGRYRSELLSLQISIIAPQYSYDITPNNLYDFDLPPGLVTLAVAKTVMNLYRRGGRLTPKSVHKLLRLGFKSLRAKSNTTRVSIAPEDTLTVVGDLHGELKFSLF